MGGHRGRLQTGVLGGGVVIVGVVVGVCLHEGLEESHLRAHHIGQLRPAGTGAGGGGVVSVDASGGLVRLQQDMRCGAVRCA